MRKSRAQDTPSPDPGTSGPAGSPPQAEARFPRPKILVIDAPDVTPALQQRGYAAVSGSFGQPTRVAKGPGYQPVRGGFLPGYTEQEIVVVDLVGPEPQQPAVEPVELPGPGVPSIWARTATRLVDPRPAVMWRVRTDMDRIYVHGGVFIIFATARFDPKCIITTLDRFGNLDQHGARPLDADNWSLLSELRWLSVTGDSGQEMDVAENGVARMLGIENYFKNGRFECVVKPQSSITNQWETLATSKYGDPVGGMILPSLDTSNGLIFVLPQVEHRADLVIELIDRVLPEIRPRLFPHAEGSRWTRRPEYDLPRINELKNEIVKIEEAARTAVRALEEQIELERAEYGFLHDLLTASGDDLVRAVIQALNKLGFHDVEDVDADVEAAGKAGPLREDIRIMDAAVPVLVEVKGIAGTPREASSLQVTKYLAPRMREWDRADLHGLAIINHQRRLPALDREHEHVFQADVLSNAEDQGFSLLTTWDLFRLVRGFVVHGWRHEDVAGLFVTPGRIRPIPVHYELIGSVDGYWGQASALGLRLQSGPLRAGNRIAYETPVDFIEEDVTSLQLGSQNVEEAQSGDHVGLKTTLSKEQARKGVRVYRVAPRGAHPTHDR
jgi:hypothetical protein